MIVEYLRKNGSVIGFSVTHKRKVLAKFLRADYINDQTAWKAASDFRRTAVPPPETREDRAAKTMKGHKGQFGLAISCECGWTSAIAFGKGARTLVSQDFRAHKEKHLV
jgi:hypothetical protein